MDARHEPPLQQALSGRSSQPDSASIALEAIFRAFPDLLFIVDLEGRILEYRAGDLSLLYLPPDQFLGRSMQQVLPAGIATMFARAIESAAVSAGVTSLRYTLPTPRGERRFESRLVLAAPGRIAVMVREITGYVAAAERARQQLRQVSSLHAIDVAISASFDHKVTLLVILREVLSQLEVDAADVLLLNPATGMLEFVAGQGFHTPGFEGGAVRLGQGYAGTAALERRTVSTSEFNPLRPGGTASPHLQAEGFVSYYAVPLLAKGQVKGVLEVYHRSLLEPGEAWLEFLASLASRAALAVESAEMFNDLQRSNTELSLAYDAAIEGWALALELSGRESREHTRRVLDLTLRLARRLGLGEAELALVHRGVLLHDIGYFGIPELILLKPGPLTEGEMAVVREHPRLAVQMLRGLPQLANALDIPCHHHERWDGSGYPDALAGERIPLPARIFAVVDVYDAMTSPRPHRPPHPKAEVLAHLRESTGVLFDPKVVEEFLMMMGEGEKS